MHMRTLTAIFIFLPFAHAVGQPADTLSGGLHFPQDSLLNIYDSRKDSLSLYNGRQFYGYSLSIEGSAFFQANEWGHGSVLYDGAWYRNVELMYDLYRDELIARHPVGIPIVLFRERVQEFILTGKVFVYLEKDKNNVVSNGFYQRVTDGKATVYAKRVRKLEEKIDGLFIERKFILADQFFVLKVGVYYTVKKQKGLLALFKDKRQEISEYKGRLKQKYKTNPEQFIVNIADYYNQLLSEK
jgi:hypothetical protein